MCQSCGINSCKCKAKKICGCDTAVKTKCIYYDAATTLPTLNIMKNDEGNSILQKIENAFKDLADSVAASIPATPALPMTESTPGSTDGFVLFMNKTTGEVSWQPARIVTLT
jgi:hypothetical protein